MSSPVIIHLKRIDTALTKAELIEHLDREHSDAIPAKKDRLTKATLIDLHRLIHLGLGQ